MGNYLAGIGARVERGGKMVHLAALEEAEEEYRRRNFRPQDGQHQRITGYFVKELEHKAELRRMIEEGMFGISNSNNFRISNTYRIVRKQR